MPLIEKREAAEGVRLAFVNGSVCEHRRETVTPAEEFGASLGAALAAGPHAGALTGNVDVLDDLVRAGVRAGTLAPTHDLRLLATVLAGGDAVSAWVALYERPPAWRPIAVDFDLTDDLGRYRTPAALLLYGAAPACECRVAEHYRDLVVAAGTYAQGIVRAGAARGVPLRLRPESLAVANPVFDAAAFRHMCTLTLGNDSA